MAKRDNNEMYCVGRDNVLDLEAWAHYDDGADVYEVFASESGEDFIGNADSLDEARALAKAWFNEKRGELE